VLVRGFLDEPGLTFWLKDFRRQGLARRGLPVDAPPGKRRSGIFAGGWCSIGEGRSVAVRGQERCVKRSRPDLRRLTAANGPVPRRGRRFSARARPGSASRFADRRDEPGQAQERFAVDDCDKRGSTCRFKPSIRGRRLTGPGSHPLTSALKAWGSRLAAHVADWRRLPPTTILLMGTPKKQGKLGATSAVCGPLEGHETRGAQFWTGWQRSADALPRM